MFDSSANWRVQAYATSSYQTSSGIGGSGLVHSTSSGREIEFDDWRRIALGVVYARHAHVSVAVNVQA